MDPLAEKFSGNSPYNYCLNNPIALIDPDGREVIAPNKASKQLVLQSVTYMFGKNHGYSFEGNKLVHSGAVPSGMSKGQQSMFSYFNESLVNSKTKTTVLAGQRMSTIHAGGEYPSIVAVGTNAAGTTFGVDTYTKYATNGESSIPVHFNAQNLILLPHETIDNGVNAMTYGGLSEFGSDHVLAHEFGHAIVNTIMSEFGGEFNGVDFNSMPDIERSDWAIKFTNTLLSGKKKESGEGQHGRDLNTRPKSNIEGL